MVIFQGDHSAVAGPEYLDYPLVEGAARRSRNFNRVYTIQLRRSYP
ncbi:MAG: hypothetical protein MI923_27685 [Phycisphaerales bacterium]|nr:hypothetical protein [Phycisphaerales bacterium]